MTPAGSPCPRWRAELTALVDGGLDAQRAERVTEHLLECPACAAEVESLRALRRCLAEWAREAPGPTASEPVVDRLVAIAGPRAGEPLRAPVFGEATSAGLGLPSRRRRRRQLAGATAASLAVGLAGVGTVGWLAAPSWAERNGSDATAAASTRFLADRSAVPLSALLADPAALAAGRTARGPVNGLTSPRPDAVRLTGDEADEVLARARSAEQTVPLRGEQVVLERVPGTGSGNDAAWSSARLSVSFRPGEGTRTRAVGADGSLGETSFQPQPVTGVETSGLWSAWHLAGLRDAGDVAGRPTTVLEARGPSGAVAARWWLDAESGAPLRTDVFDDGGHLRRTSAFTTVSVGEAISDPAESGATERDSGSPDPTALGLPATLAGMTPVETRRLDDGVHALYTNGIHAVALTAARGTAATPTGEAWQTAFCSGRVWQSGDTVWTVVSDADPARVDAIVAALPHRPAASPGPITRIAAGWENVWHAVGG